MAELSPEEIRHLGHLARLELRPEEESRFAGQLSTVVSYVEQLQAVPTDHLGQLQGVTGQSNVLAADEPRSENDLCAVPRQELLKGVPKSEAGFIMVRAVMGDEVSGA